MSNKRRWRALYFVSALAIAVMAFVVNLAIRFTHPDYTETQLFLRFWYIWLVIFLLYGIAVYLVRKFPL